MDTSTEWGRRELNKYLWNYGRESTRWLHERRVPPTGGARLISPSRYPVDQRVHAALRCRVGIVVARVVQAAMDARLHADHPKWWDFEHLCCTASAELEVLQRGLGQLDSHTAKDLRGLLG